MPGTQARRVLYIHPAKLPGWVERTWREAFASFHVMPMGAVALANLLGSHGFEVTGLNYPMELDLDPRFDLLGWLARRPAPLMVMVDLHWLEHSFGALEVARVCKQVYPNTPVVIGGLTASQYAGEILEQFPQVDFVIRGDAERGLVQLARHLAHDGADLSQVANLSLRRDGEVLSGPLAYTASALELDALDFVGLGFLVHREEYYWRQSSRYGALRGQWLCVARGCRHDCCWCGGGKSAHARIAGRKGLVARSPQRLVGDLAEVADLGLDQAALSHDLALPGREYWERVLAGLARRRSGLGLWHQQFQLPSRGFLDAFAKSARVETSLMELSPLSGSDEVRRINGKLFSTDSFLRVLEECRGREIPLFVYFSLNLPGENANTFQQTLALARRVREMYPAHLLRMSNMFHTLDPASAIARRSEQYRLRVRWSGFGDYYRYCQQSTEADSDETIAALRGFESVEPRPLAGMFQQWVELCHELGEDTCLHFP